MSATLTPESLRPRISAADSSRAAGANVAAHRHVAGLNEGGVGLADLVGQVLH